MYSEKIYLFFCLALNNLSIENGITKAACPLIMYQFYQLATFPKLKKSKLLSNQMISLRLLKFSCGAKSLRQTGSILKKLKKSPIQSLLFQNSGQQISIINYLPINKNKNSIHLEMFVFSSFFIYSCLMPKLIFLLIMILSPLFFSFSVSNSILHSHFYDLMWCGVMCVVLCVYSYFSFLLSLNYTNSNSNFSHFFFFCRPSLRMEFWAWGAWSGTKMIYETHMFQISYTNRTDPIQETRDIPEINCAGVDCVIKHSLHATAYISMNNLTCRQKFYSKCKKGCVTLHAPEYNLGLPLFPSIHPSILLLQLISPPLWKETLTESNCKQILNKHSFSPLFMVYDKMIYKILPPDSLELRDKPPSIRLSKTCMRKLINLHSPFSLFQSLPSIPNFLSLSLIFNWGCILQATLKTLVSKASSQKILNQILISAHIELYSTSSIASIEKYGDLLRALWTHHWSYIKVWRFDEPRTESLSRLTLFKQTSTYLKSTHNTQPIRARHSQIKCKQAF
ncbi:hypothetical protein VP01_1679g4 [Puccinia sorghi]|uniref:Uncharacterized protein n=1 Tax=Puccinia sorghi TaxID=27349 RepID=A0A0L6VFZ2_9BASI|nr:hypothetical protein VP01_1679g4 [Puccinia sorghi]